MNQSPPDRQKEDALQRAKVDVWRVCSGLLFAVTRAHIWSGAAGNADNLLDRCGRAWSQYTRPEEAIDRFNARSVDPSIFTALAVGYGRRSGPSRNLAADRRVFVPQTLTQ